MQRIAPVAACVLCRRRLKAFEPFLPLVARPAKGEELITIAAHFGCFVEAIARRTGTVTVDELEGRREDEDTGNEFDAAVARAVRELIDEER